MVSRRAVVCIIAALALLIGGGIALPNHGTGLWLQLLGGAISLVLLTVLARGARAPATRTELTRTAAEEEQLRLLVEGVPGFFFFAQDLAGDVTYVSPSVAAITGRPAAEWLGQHHWYATDNPINAAARATTARHLAGRTSDDRIVIEIRHADGHPILLEIHEYPLVRDGRVAGIQGLAHDITAEAAASRRQQALADLARAASEAATLDDLFTAIHRIIGDLTGARNMYVAVVDEASGTLRFPYFVDERDSVPEAREGGRGLTEYVLRTGMPLSVTAEVYEDLCRRGEIDRLGSAPVDWVGVPLISEGRAFGVLAVQSYTPVQRFGDRERHLLEFVSSQVAAAIRRQWAVEELGHSEERYRLLVELSPDAIAIHSAGRVVFANTSAARLFGSGKPEDLVGRPSLDFVHPEHRAAALQRIEAALASDTPQPFAEEVFLRADGSGVPVEVAATPFEYRGEPAMLVVARDITGRRELESQLQRAQRLEAVGRLAGGIAHDFNNLLQALLSTMQILRLRAGDPGEQERAVTELEAHIRRGASLTRQLLLFSRREVVKLEPLDLGAVVLDASTLLRRLVRENVEFTVLPPERTLPVKADRGQLEQILVNLVVNAVDAVDGAGRIRLATGSDGAMAWFEVRDTGAGIDADALPRIFEPFYSSKSADRGTGLGLAVVHGIVTNHGGRVDVDSRMGEGSTFRILLPLLQEDARPADPPAGETTELPRGSGERILVVEDEDGAREGLRELLDLLGYEVVAAASGEEAEKAADEAVFDVLLTDLLLPGAHGEEIAGRLQRKQPEIAVIVMSGYAEDEAVRRDVRSGAVRFLQKPFAVATLAHELRTVLGPRRQP